MIRNKENKYANKFIQWGSFNCMRDSVEPKRESNVDMKSENDMACIEAYIFMIAS